MRVTVQDGRVIRIQGDPDHPTTHGALCTKVSRYAERTHHPDRVLHPLKRVGPKGSGQFVQVGWDEALADIARRLGDIAARDPQAIVPYSYAGTMGLVQGESIAARFFHALGASLLDRTICASAGAEALMLTYGGKVGMHVEHFAESRLILIWGSNSIASNLHFWTYANAARRQGAKLVCIDPRRTETAEKCHQHIALRPGTDGALALGLMHELIANGWVDRDYVARHLEGYEALAERALQWPPERVAEVCGITPEEVRQLARDYGSMSPAAIRLNYGMQRVRGGGNAVRLVALLPCLTGAWRHRAGGLLLSSSGWFPVDRAALQRPDLLQGRRPRVINMSTIGDDLLRDAGQNVRGTLDQGGGTLEWNTPHHVLGQSSLLIQLLTNLISNGLKFRAEDRAAHVQVTSHLEGEFVRVTVQDNGIGIAPEYHARVFDIFQRLHRREQYAGNGMGLAICRKIVEFHGGRIWLESVPAQGSTFHLTLPVAPSQ